MQTVRTDLAVEVTRDTAAASTALTTTLPVPTFGSYSAQTFLLMWSAIGTSGLQAARRRGPQTTVTGRSRFRQSGSDPPDSSESSDAAPQRHGSPDRECPASSPAASQQITDSSHASCCHDAGRGQLAQRESRFDEFTDVGTSYFASNT